VKYTHLRQTVHCDFIYTKSAKKIQDDFITAAKAIHNPLECKLDVETETIRIIQCDLIDEGRIKKYTTSFEKLCKNIAGNDANIEGQKLKATQAGGKTPAG
jgi:hypothetical protein